MDGAEGGGGREVESAFAGAEAMQQLESNGRGADHPEALLDEYSQKRISNRVVDIVGDRFGQDSRVIHRQDGAHRTDELVMRPDLDPGVFVDQLRGYDRFGVTQEYSLNGPQDAASERVTFDLGKGDLMTRVEFLRGQVPKASEIGVDEAGESYARELPITNELAFRIADSLSALHAAFSEHDAFIQHGQGGDYYGMNNSDRDGRGSVEG